MAASVRLRHLSNARSCSLWQPSATAWMPSSVIRTAPLMSSLWSKGSNLPTKARARSVSKGRPGSSSSERRGKERAASMTAPSSTKEQREKSRTRISFHTSKGSASSIMSAMTRSATLEHTASARASKILQRSSGRRAANVVSSSSATSLRGTDRRQRSSASRESTRRSTYALPTGRPSHMPEPSAPSMMKERRSGGPSAMSGMGTCHPALPAHY
mmetsp:Transcript_19169/g.52876  ORF Transcript_19169/g.52876 Transcript_19169/m.52876 type:complete len:215 (-) Transcript_19169:2766-3410(-)